MPRMKADIYAAHVDNALKLAARQGGVSRPQLINELNITRGTANKIIDEAGLALDRTVKRVQFFVPNGDKPVEAKQSRPTLVPPVQAVTVPTSEDSKEPDDDTIEDLDLDIVDTRNALREAAKKAGKALGDWATHQALVDALRERLAALASKRMSI